MLKTLALMMLFAACTTAPQADEPAPKHMLYICYTHATCDGNTVNQEHRLCADTAPNLDYATAGDAAALDWVTLWEGTCRADEGIVLTSVERHPGEVCETSNGDAATWGCDADCEPQFEDCEP